ncbi:MAG: amino acid ABC transporter ATP-binding protein, partial [Clostridium sp.]|uniref:ATP-binding cassette domain-containing protein n=1 Tax=Clostridium sp. TaxID=1506 RepID=UPI0025BB22EE
LRQRIGMVFQSYDLFPHMTVLDNIMLGPVKAQKRSKDEIKIQAINLLKRVGLEDKTNSYPRQLSGGQKQRLTIARALVGSPKIIILDDSSSALDFATDLKLRQALNTYAKDITTIIVSQRASSIKNSDKIVVLDDGKLAGIGTHEELLENSEVYKEICLSQLTREEAYN